MHVLAMVPMLVVDLSMIPRLPGSRSNCIYNKWREARGVFKVFDSLHENDEPLSVTGKDAVYKLDLLG
jgi:hypothetical protein